MASQSLIHQVLVPTYVRLVMKIRFAVSIPYTSGLSSYKIVLRIPWDLESQSLIHQVLVPTASSMGKPEGLVSIPYTSGLSSYV